VRDIILAATNKCLAKNNKSPDGRGATIEAKPPMKGYRAAAVDKIENKLIEAMEAINEDFGR
jgi:hypothetical protein